MQLAEEEIHAKCGSDEELMNFRPSPNFKHKKYLRSKFEESMMNKANSSCMEPNVLSLGHNKLEKVINTLVVTAPAQPPLPPNPPPPDTPPLITNIKQEIEDDECNTSETLSEFSQSEELKAASATIKTDQSDDKPNVTMCRNFARGTCKKGAACIFAHELILSQLPAVYTFCRNFQNSVCTFPKCKFVHASVFEKENFYRTGYLPPHTLAHLKEASVQQHTPAPQSEAPAEQPTVNCNAPPPPQIACISPVAVRYNEAVVEPDVFRIQPGTSNDYQKRGWSQIDEVSSLTSDRDSGESLPKRCKHCASNELSERLLDFQIEQARRRNQERIPKIAEITKKKNLITSVLALILKPNTSSQVEELQNAANRHNENLSTNNMLRSMLSKMLMNMDSGLPPDA